MHVNSYRKCTSDKLSIVCIHAKAIFLVDLKTIKIKSDSFRFLLGHVDERFVVVEPQIVVGHAHLVERDFLGVFEETVRPPQVLQPADVQVAVLFGHVLRTPQAVISPALCQKDVGHVRLVDEKWHHDTRIFLSSWSPRQSVCIRYPAIVVRERLGQHNKGQTEKHGNKGINIYGTQ